MKIFDQHPSAVVGAVLLALLVVLGIYLVSAGLLKRLDLVIYDVVLPLQSPEMSEQIVVVGIDDNSLQDLGRWPWTRTRHAQLLDKLSSMKARAIGMDILFSEHQLDNTFADDQLAQALQDNGRSILVVAPVKQNGSDLVAELMPIPALASSAAALGHVDVELDLDGLCRSSFLHAGIGDARWPSLPLALLKTGGESISYEKENQETISGSGWLRQNKILIPFTHPGNKPVLVSYSDLLADRIPASTIENKYVLVGATAAGLGDAISTPGAFSHERMSGVELNAQILNGLLQGKSINELSVFQQTILTIFLIAVSVLLILLLPMRLSLVLTVTGAIGVLAISIILLTVWRIWFPPAVAMSIILIAWPLWNAWQINRQEQLRERLLLQLENQARYHIATGLPTYGMLVDRLRSLTENKDASTELSVLMVVHINWPGSASVILDRPISDPILKSIGERLRSISDEKDFIAHLSGDDFAILSSGYTGNAAIGKAASILLTKLQEPLQQGEDKLLLAPQIGVSVWPTDTQDANALLRNAYTAMFKSRIDDTEHLCLYSSSIRQEIEARSKIEQALVFALERGEFKVFYQPQINALTGQIVGVEALLRWFNPKLGWIGPDAFIPVAEHVGLIMTIGEWVIETACTQLDAWKQAGFKHMRLAINVSPLQFVLPGLDVGIKRVIERTGINPGDIELEITESSLMHDVDSAVRLMREIKKYGVELAIDDFGTGYSSLSSLRLFPLDRLKIDKSFTQELGKNDGSTAITLTILDMAKHLGLKVIAEGVETREQAEFLRQHGCDEFQGFLYGQPVAAGEITRIMHEEIVVVDY